MLNLRPGNVAGLTRAAYLRELHGDLSGAVELMHMAYDATPFQESEDRAWLLTQIAHLQLLSGNLPEAEMYANGALGLFPNYHYALGTLAQVRVEQNRNDEAITLLEKRYARRRMLKTSSHWPKLWNAPAARKTPPEFSLSSNGRHLANRTLPTTQIMS